MFHKALWMRQWKQGKYVVLLFWLTSLNILPYRYYSEAANEFSISTQNFDDYVYYYSYHFSAFDSVFTQSVLIVIMACLFIGWERNNQSIDFLHSMPFKRKDIYLTKWLFGTVNIIAVNIVCWVSMYAVKNMSFHDNYQVFSPLHTYFVYATVVLVAVYTLALFIGTITGNIFSQSGLSAILLFFPYGLALLVSGFLYTHTANTEEESYKIERKTWNYLEHINTFAPVDNFSIQYNYHPIVEVDKEGNTISEKPQDNPMEYTFIPPAWKLLTPLAYIIVFLPIGTLLYTRAPNEQNGKLLLFPRLQKWFMFCTVLCFALFGGSALGTLGSTESILQYYIGFFLAGIVSYFVFSRLLKMKFSFGGK